MRLSALLCIRKAPSDFTTIHSGLGKYTTDYSNLPQRYIKRKITKVDWRAPNQPNFNKRIRSFVPRVHNLERPWADTYWRKNKAFDFSAELPVVEPIKESDWMWFRGDRVEILKGPDKGKQGLIKDIVQERNWVTVTGLNTEPEFVGKKGSFPGMMMMKEQPLLVTTDIRLVDPSDENGAKVEWRYTREGDRVRVAVKSGTVIPVPSIAYETIDYKDPASYKPNEFKDTPARIVEEITYEPCLSTFEMDIMKSMGIKETQIPKKTWWY